MLLLEAFKLELRHRTPFTGRNVHRAPGVRREGGRAERIAGKSKKAES